MKKKTLFIILTLLLSFNACTFWGVRGNGKLKTQTRNIENFDRLEVGGVFSVKVEIGKAEIDFCFLFSVFCFSSRAFAPVCASLRPARQNWPRFTTCIVSSPIARP